MKKTLLQIKNAQSIGKEKQRKLNGGRLGGPSSCGSGCYQYYDCPGYTGNGHLCVVINEYGEECTGAILNGVCCL